MVDISRPKAKQRIAYLDIVPAGKHKWYVVYISSAVSKAFVRKYGVTPARALLSIASLLLFPAHIKRCELYYHGLTPHGRIMSQNLSEQLNFSVEVYNRTEDELRVVLTENELRALRDEGARFIKLVNPVPLKLNTAFKYRLASLIRSIRYTVHEFKKSKKPRR
jgi:hypothetical protein